MSGVRSWKQRLSSVLLVPALVASLLVFADVAEASPGVVVFDDMEHGNPFGNGWFTFGGAVGGGGIDPNSSDLPPTDGGLFSLQTGWGSGGVPGFFGGFGRTSPTDLTGTDHFNFWINPDPTQDYTLEINLQDDDNGDNAFDPAFDDEFRFSCVVSPTGPCAVAGGGWQQISIPFDDFGLNNAGGNGVLDAVPVAAGNGQLINIVFVVVSNSGADATFRTDYWAFSEGPLNALVFDDMEHGNPFGNGWFAFGGSVGGGGIGPDADVPPVNGGSFSLGTGWGSGGVPGFFGGFGRTNPTDLTGTDHFNFWINPDGVDSVGRDQDYILEINLQEDDNGDGAIAQPDDDEFQFNCLVSPTGPCAVAGGGWQQISIPLADFYDDGSFLFGGNGVLDAVPTSGGGNGQLINVVIGVVSNAGADATFRTDYWSFSAGPLMPEPSLLIDDFEAGVAPGGACPGGDGPPPPLGFCTFGDDLSAVTIAAVASPPAPPVPDSGSANNVLELALDVNAFGGFIRGFGSTLPEPQDWSGFEGVRFWLFGQNTGTSLFVDILDNRSVNSTSDDAERFTVSLTDDFSGWQEFEFPFSDFVRKDIGRATPNDGFGLTEIHGWAFGTLNTGGPVTYYLENFELYGAPVIPPPTVGFSNADFNVLEGKTGQITVKLNRPLGADTDDPTQVSVSYSIESIVAEVGRDFEPVAGGTLTFVTGEEEKTFSITTIDDEKYEPTERLILRLSNPTGAEFGEIRQATANILDDELFDQLLIDDFEGYPYLWEAGDNVTLGSPILTADDPVAVPGQGAYEGVLQATTVGPEIEIEGRLCKRGKGVVPVVLYSTDSFDATTVDHTTVKLGNASEVHVDKKTGEAERHEEDVDGDGDVDLVFHFRFADTDLPCDPTVIPLEGETFDGSPITGNFDRDFPIGQDWSDAEGMSFWYYGQNSGSSITVHLKDNRAPDPGPDGWSLVWEDEFEESAGTPPNPEYWDYELGDGAVNGIPGWGNDELQYYTSSEDNVAHDGAGNLVITAQEADPTAGLQCYYGPCEYTSARLVTKNRAEFAYGRIESSILVPEGPDGLWPAFWSLGTDIDLVNWPQTGEIDFMEYVSRIPDEIFGTIHGPGYSGGESFGGFYFDFEGESCTGDRGACVANEYHTYAIEWEPDLIKWYVDDILYHTATPADVPGPWVFNDPVYFLLNLAIGGNFGGELSGDLTFPQSMKVDYVRVYQGPDTAERFAAGFVDDFEGWQQVEIPFADFVRSSEQPTDAPDDGLSLDEVWGYGFTQPGGGELLIDQVRLVQPPGAATVIDDFEDGSSSDWGFFGGNNAGGGGGALEGGAKEGDFYFNTGWGGDGTASGFYGGTFKNFPNPLRVRPPADPWFNVWVRNETTSTVDQYTLEMTIREDAEGDGYTESTDVSCRFDAVFSQVDGDFNGDWTLVSAPISDFRILAGFQPTEDPCTTFEGDLDEIVIVIGGVQGGLGSSVDVDFDYFAFTSGGPLVP